MNADTIPLTAPVAEAPAPIPEAPATRHEMVVAWLACDSDVARTECVKRFPELAGIMSEAKNFAPRN